MVLILSSVGVMIPFIIGEHALKLDLAKHPAVYAAATLAAAAVVF